MVIRFALIKESDFIKKGGSNDILNYLNHPVDDS